MKLNEAVNTTKIEVVVTAKGCPEACLQCGAYQDLETKADYVMVELDKKSLKANLERVILGTRVKVADLLANFVTTDVNTEPLRGTAFGNLAELVYELSEENSQLVCISHGVRYSSEQMKQEMLKIVKLMEEGVVPLFVLSVDCARNKAKISTKANIKGYTKTLTMLKPVLDLIAKKRSTDDPLIPDLRVTISLQGVDDEKSPLYRGKAEQMFQEVLKRVDFTPAQRAVLHIDRGRKYAKIGRAKKYLESIDEGECAVIPDKDFVENCLKHEHLFRAKLELDGRVYRQANNRRRSYNDTITGRWELLENHDCNNGEEEKVEEIDHDTIEFATEKVLEDDQETYDVGDYMGEDIGQEDSEEESKEDSLPGLVQIKNLGRGKKKNKRELGKRDALRSNVGEFARGRRNKRASSAIPNSRKSSRPRLSFKDDSIKDDFIKDDSLLPEEEQPLRVKRKFKQYKPSNINKDVLDAVADCTKGTE